MACYCATKPQPEMMVCLPAIGAFVACSFWLVNVLCLVGRTGEANARFEELLKLQNDVGLLSEEYDTHLGRQIGNFPQALSHIALVNAAFEFCKESPPVRQRAAS